MIKYNFKKAVALGMCCTIISSGTVFAMPKNNLLNETPTGIKVEIDHELLEKQREIDLYVFESHVKEIAEKGFTVTHTGPNGDYVEIGILPYTQENADYLYEVFGKGKVRIVEGIQAVTLPSTPSNMIPENKIIRKGNGIGIRINDEWLQTDEEPFIHNNSTLIPLRGVLEKLGAKVEWHPKQKLVRIYTEDITIELVVGEDTVKVVRNIDGTPKEEILKLEVPAKMSKNRTFIPGRFVAQTLGAKVEWDQTLRAMIIKANKKSDVIEVEKEIKYEIVGKEALGDHEALASWYKNNFDQEGIHFITDEQWNYVLISAGQKSTGGYSIKIDSITQVTPKTAYVHATLTSPSQDAFVTQALTYPNVIARFHKGNIEEIQGDLIGIQKEDKEVDSISYKNTQYGFSFSLPNSWEGYKIVTDQWEGFFLEDSKEGKKAERGPMISIRHPQWTSENPRQDIPIMIFTLDQWNSLQKEEFHIGAAPIGPKEIGRNDEYVFALPARYNYAFPSGYEEVETILNNDALKIIK